MQEGKDKNLPSFWIPSLTPQAEATKVEKPVSKAKLCFRHVSQKIMWEGSFYFFDEMLEMLIKTMCQSNFPKICYF